MLEHISELRNSFNSINKVSENKEKGRELR